jgi:hypothetical protein
VCVCGLFLGCLWQCGYCLFFFLWVNFPSLLLAKKTREYRSIYIFYYFNSIWLCGHLVNCIEAVLFNSWCYCIVCKIHNKNHHVVKCLLRIGAIIAHRCLNLSHTLPPPSLKLDGSNYLSWQSQFLPILNCNDLLELVVEGFDPENQCW